MNTRQSASLLLECVQKLKAKESILDGISDVLMLLDANTYTILDANRAFLKLYGLSRDEVIGKRCHRITHHFEKPCSRQGHGPCPLEHCRKTGESFRTTHAHKNSKGGTLFLEINAYPLTDSEGKVTQIIHTAKDVTSQKEAENELKEKLTRSEHLAQLGQLVAEITHEIKNPLMMIGGYAKRLYKPVDEETKLKHLDVITEQTARLDKLLADLRAYHLSKAAVRESLNIKEILTKIHSLAKDECAKRKIRSELALNGTDPLIYWDPNKLDQVLINVVKNAIEAMETGGLLSIRAESTDQMVKIIISDSGSGIPEHHLEKILECFFTTKSHGTGLGLCISKKYVDEHAGTLMSIKSEEHKGTTVEIDIPLLQEPRTGGE